MQDDALHPIGGEFRDSQREAEFRTDHVAETRRQARLLLIVSAVLNTLFLFSDWRFAGDPHFFVAVPARLVVIAMSFVCLAAVVRVTRAERLEALLAVWMAVVAVAVGALVSSQSDIALFVVIILPSIYLLVVPTGFLTTAAGGLFGGIAVLVGYLMPGKAPATALGLVLVVLLLYCALILVLTRYNRLARLAWSAARRERLTNAELALSKKRFEQLFDAAPVPFVLTREEDGRILQYNIAARHYLGGDPEAFGVQSIRNIYADPERRHALLEELRTHGRVQGFEMVANRADGEMRDVIVAATRIDVGDGPSVLAGVVDITERKVLETRLERVLDIDALTGLDNRSHFFNEAQRVMQACGASGATMGLLCASLDGLADINARFGARQGDIVIKRAASAVRGLLVDGASLKDTLGRPDLAARIDGNVFAFLVAGRAPADVRSLAETLRRGIAGLDLTDVAPDGSVTLSVGIADVPLRGDDVFPSLLRADAARRAARAQGGDRVVDANAPDLKTISPEGAAA